MLLAFVAFVVLGTVAAVIISAAADAAEQQVEIEEEGDELVLGAGIIPSELATGLRELQEEQAADISEGAADVWRAYCEQFGIVITDDTSDDQLEAYMEQMGADAEATDFDSVDGSWICCMDALAYELENRGKDADFFFEWIEETFGWESLQIWYTAVGDALMATSCSLNANFFNNLNERIETWLEDEDRWWN